MSDSLRDQLLKAGFAEKPKQQSKPSAQKPSHVANRAKTRPAAPDVDLAHAYARRAQAERAESAQAQREAERVAREKKERKQKLAALLAGKALNDGDADTPRHFPHGNKIRRIYCTREQLAALNRGELAVVQLAGRYLLVTREVAAQAQTIQPEALVLLCDPDAPAEDDVPADLMW
ncbi:MAG: DUF2058 family protein [Xanthomonadaceae bacterium]|nr:DUF2058 family protein [Xanthomonadaceae bacterium]MDE2083834.1 DUF2058 family protein [Xanthomonadaceae bacterium]MDE2256309.1 DUF2058 family protein [Xanthomonadaceae bacterium]